MLVVRVADTAAGGSTISNTAQATTTTDDTNSLNNSASATTQVQQPTAATGLTITLVSRHAKYKNEFGLFIVDDAQGRIGNLLPGDSGYARAAVSRTKIVFGANTKIRTTANLTLPPGGHFGMYLVQNSTSSKLLRKNPENRLGRGPLMFFSFAAANPDGFNHVRSSGTRYNFEDMTSGGDRDFDDLVIDIRPRR